LLEVRNPGPTPVQRLVSRFSQLHVGVKLQRIFKKSYIFGRKFQWIFKKSWILRRWPKILRF